MGKTCQAADRGGHKVVETARTTISPDGKTLLREIHVKGPDGEMSWTEVYERQ